MRPETLSVLVDIRNAARFITDDTAGATYEGFLEDRRTRQAVLFNFLIIGEAMNRLRRRDPNIAKQIVDIHQIIGMRNALIHGYDVADYTIVWTAIQETLPVLVEQIEAMLPQDAQEVSGENLG